MALYALSDLHLSYAEDARDMTIYSPIWKEHEEKIKRNWLSTVTEDDTIVLGGDLSWGKSLEDCRQDFEFVLGLPGRKIMLRGNHDRFWRSNYTERLNKEFEGRLLFLQDNFYSYKGYALVGSKGYCFENLDPFDHFRRIQKREVKRLKKSFEEAAAAGFDKYIVFLHYPPTSCIWPPTHELCEALGYSPAQEELIKEKNRDILRAHGYVDIGRNLVINLKNLSQKELLAIKDCTEYLSSPITDLISKYKAEQVIYGHSHGKEHFDDSILGEHHGSLYRLSSGDYVDFAPIKILD
ncbi:metallophosphoesterase [Butyrivibrio sp. MC2013]|uniref:metallophosphoesterase n=1 Tax=Butyrivibrio sp. MC2013 TaxID=1280686 RepID=UPI00041699FD|nr:metallophosphoesterase [Butyrivibrio sp. MC2013]